MLSSITKHKFQQILKLVYSSPRLTRPCSSAISRFYLLNKKGHKNELHLPLYLLLKDLSKKQAPPNPAPHREKQNRQGGWHRSTSYKWQKARFSDSNLQDGFWGQLLGPGHQWKRSEGDIMLQLSVLSVLLVVYLQSLNTCWPTC